MRSERLPPPFAGKSKSVEVLLAEFPTSGAEGLQRDGALDAAQDFGRQQPRDGSR